ncbi:hypothetical protein FRC02_011761 [Tulasnella sp. 418]|nr:hypothetical protein FRC02_011761 [Tulasnella sp. 418]
MPISTSCPLSSIVSSAAMAAYRLSTITTTVSDSVSHMIPPSDTPPDEPGGTTLGAREVPFHKQDSSTSVQQETPPPPYTPSTRTRSASLSITRQRTSSTTQATHRRAHSQTTEQRTWRLELAFEGGPSSSSHVVIGTIVGFVLGFGGMLVSIWAVILARVLPSFRAKPHPSTITHHTKSRPEHLESQFLSAEKPSALRIPTPSIASGHTSDSSRKVTFQLEPSSSKADPSSPGAASLVTSIDSPINSRFPPHRSRPASLPPRSESIDSYASSGQASCSSSVDYQPTSSSGFGAWYKRRGHKAKNGKDKDTGTDDEISQRASTISAPTEAAHQDLDSKNRLQLSMKMLYPSRKNSSSSKASKRRSLPPDAFSDSKLVSEPLASPESYLSSELHSAPFSPTATISSATTSSMDGDSERGVDTRLDTVTESPSKETSSQGEQFLESPSRDMPSSTSYPVFPSSQEREKEKEKDKRSRHKTFSFSNFTAKSTSNPPVRLRTNPYAAPFNAPLPVARERHRSTEKRPQLVHSSSSSDAKSSPASSTVPASSLQLDLGPNELGVLRTPTGLGMGRPSTMPVSKSGSFIESGERRVISETSTSRRSPKKSPTSESSSLLPSKSYSDTESASATPSKAIGFANRCWPGMKSSKKSALSRK